MSKPAGITTPEISSTSQAISILIVTWLIYLATLGVLQLCGFQLGFNVWPMGEDRDWIGFIYDGHGAKIAHLFWRYLDDRNPFSPWWWIVVSPIVKHFEWGLYAVRKCIDPYLAIITFILLDRIGRFKCRTFAFCVALVVLFWNFSAYYEQIMWNFLGALGLTLLSIFFYCRYLDNNRLSKYDLPLSMLFYFIAIATYTLQCGAIIAIGLLGLFRHSDSEPLKARIKSTTKDVSLFLILFILFNCIWYTVNRNGATFYALHWSTISSQFLDSIQLFFFHSAYKSLFNFALHDWSSWTIAGIFVVAFLGFILVFYQAAKRDVFDGIRAPIGWAVAILLAIALPTILVESTTTIWSPGSRSLMVQQIWQPLLYISIIFLVANLLPVKNKQGLQKWKLGVVALLGACVVTGGLNYNHRLVLRTHYEAVLTKGLQKITIPPDMDRHYFLLKIIDPTLTRDINTICLVVPNYGKTMLHRKNAIVRAIATYPDKAFTKYWKIGFGPDNKGIVNAAPLGNDKAIPYKDVWIVFFDGEKVWVPKTINKNDFDGLQVAWQRKKPIDQSGKQQ